MQIGWYHKNLWDSGTKKPLLLLLISLLVLLFVSVGYLLYQRQKREAFPTPQEIPQPPAAKSFELLTDQEKVDVLKQLAPPPETKGPSVEEKKQILEQLAPPKRQESKSEESLTEEQKKSILEALRPK